MLITPVSSLGKARPKDDEVEFSPMLWGASHDGTWPSCWLKIKCGWGDANNKALETKCATPTMTNLVGIFRGHLCWSTRDIKVATLRSIYYWVLWSWVVWYSGLNGWLSNYLKTEQFCQLRINWFWWFDFESTKMPQVWHYTHEIDVRGHLQVESWVDKCKVVEIISWEDSKLAELII